MYRASQKLETTILALAPPYTSDGTICQNWGELKAWHRATNYQYFRTIFPPDVPMVVHTAGTGPEHNIFSRREVHYAFRAWHDYLHLTLNANFSNVGEQRVCREHIRQLRKYGVPAIDRRAIWAFVAGEVAHYWQHKRFIDYKREFVTFALFHGVPAAVRRDWSYQ